RHVVSHTGRRQRLTVHQLMNVRQDAARLRLCQTPPRRLFPFRDDLLSLPAIAGLRAALRPPAVRQREAPEPKGRPRFFAKGRHWVLVPQLVATTTTTFYCSLCSSTSEKNFV